MASSTSSSSSPFSINISGAKLFVFENESKKTTASYIELNLPQESINGEKCIYCEKATAHEHDILGKIKFDPTDRKYFVSLILTSNTKFLRSPKQQTIKPKLEIVPIPTTTIVDNNKRKQSSFEFDDDQRKKKKKKNEEIRQRNLIMNKVDPVPVASLAEGAKLFGNLLKSLVVNDDASSKQSILGAAKILSTNDIFVLRAENEDKSSNFSISSSICCDICSSNDFSTMAQLQSHFQGQHRLQIRLKAFTTQEDHHRLHHHVQSEERNGYDQCEKCEIIFETNSEKLHHVNEIHAAKGECAYQCDVCLQIFKSRPGFKQHVALHAKKNKVRKHSCDLCEKRFMKKLHLQNHMLNHVGAKPYQCEKCEKKYSSSFALKSHSINSHGEGEKPKCEYCEKTFYNNSALRKHFLEVHEQDSRLGCPECGNFYLRRDNLQQHIQSVHRDKKLFSCKFCQKVYQKADTLREHQRTDHGVLPWNRERRIKRNVVTLTNNNNNNNNDDDIMFTSTNHHFSFNFDESEIDISNDIVVEDNIEEDEDELNREIDKILERQDYSRCKYCVKTFSPAEMESHLRFSHGVMPKRSSDNNNGGSGSLPVTSAFGNSSAAEALLKTLTPQPDYLLRCLTPLPLETLDDLMISQ